jgi:4-aminobutyrate aminotransferase
MKDANLLTEGDVNFSDARADWNSGLDDRTRDVLKEDAGLFLHQSLSTPCLDVLTSCEGIYLMDMAGKQYMDFHGNNVHQVGYRNPYVLNRVKAQMDVLPFSPRRFTNPIAIECARKITALLPDPLRRVLFAPGGTSAVGIALKMARAVTGKHKVVSLDDSFHGASLDAIAAGGEEQFKKHMGPLLQDSLNIAQPVRYRNIFPDGEDVHYADRLEEVILRDGHVGAFIAETVRNTDVQVPSKAYWQRIREICDRHRILLILDEIPIAFGRTGSMFTFEQYGIIPDLLCLGKGLGAGIIPIAAVVAKEQYNAFPEISLGHYTHEKSPLGCAAALGMMEFIERQGLLAKVREDAVFMERELNLLKEKHDIIGDVRGLGLLWGVELVLDRVTKEKAFKRAEKVMYECLRNGLSFKVSQGNVLQLSPPLVITREELGRAIQILDQALSRTA